MLTLCSLLDGILSFMICYLVRWHSVDFMLDASTNSTYTTTNWKWWFERNQLQNECKYKKVGPTPPVCAKKILAGNLYCSPSPPHFVAEIWRRIKKGEMWSLTAARKLLYLMSTLRAPWGSLQKPLLPSGRPCDHEPELFLHHASARSRRDLSTLD